MQKLADFIAREVNQGEPAQREKQGCFPMFTEASKQPRNTIAHFLINNIRPLSSLLNPALHHAAHDSRRLQTLPGFSHQD